MYVCIIRIDIHCKAGSQPLRFEVLDLHKVISFVCKILEYVALFDVTTFNVTHSHQIIRTCFVSGFWIACTSHLVLVDSRQSCPIAVPRICQHHMFGRTLIAGVLSLSLFICSCVVRVFCYFHQ